jgi:hypothetical protein
MPNYSLSRLERLFLQMQTAFGTIPNSSGTATVAAANACRHIKATLTNEVATLMRRDKTGSRTATQGVAGRKYGRWSTEMSLAPNGTVAVAPDCDPILQCLYGQAPTVTTAATTTAGASSAASPVQLTATGHGLGATNAFVAFVLSGHSTTLNGAWVAQVVDANTLSLLGSTAAQGGGTGGTIQKGSVKYSLSDSIPSFAMWSARSPLTLNQRVAFGCVAQNGQFNLGADIAEWTADGECLWALDSDFWSTADVTQKGGLTAFPDLTTPFNSAVTNGGIIAGFTGKAVLNGNSLASLRSGTLKIGTGNQVVKDLFGSYYPDSAEGDERNATLSFSLYDDDSTAQQNLRQLGITKTAFDTVLQVGVVAGSTVMFLCRGVQIPPHVLDDGQRRFVSNINDARCFGSSITAKDEVTMWFV